jgi:2-phospho-L-lactate guanylyltransferase
MKHLTTLIVPIKTDDSKSRLSSIMKPLTRRALSLMLLDHVLACASKTGLPIDILVIGGDSHARDLATHWNFKWLADSGLGLNHTIWFGIEESFGEGSTRALYLASDLPFLTQDDVATLIQVSIEFEGVVLCPADGDGGTNALSMPQSLKFPLLLGNDSFARHVEELHHLGYPFQSLSRPGLAFDLDTPDALEVCHSYLPDFNNSLARWENILQNLVTP